MRAYDAKHSDCQSQYEMRAVLPNLMLALVTCYTVCVLFQSSLDEALPWRTSERSTD